MQKQKNTSVLEIYRETKASTYRPLHSKMRKNYYSFVVEIAYCLAGVEVEVECKTPGPTGTLKIPPLLVLHEECSG
jgi:hypothetical protein